MNSPKTLIQFFSFLSITLLLACAEETKIPLIIDAPSAIGTKENPQLRYEYEMRQIVDPATGMLPPSVYFKEKQFAKSLNKKTQLKYLQNEEWTPVGPYNVGGRTRALALDVRNEDIIVAGGVSGRMWRSENGGNTWTTASHPNVVNGATCVAQDRSVGSENVWYHGTGELRGNSARVGGSTPYRGDGIFKSLDGGRSWDALPSTSFGDLSVFDSPFNYVWNVQVKPVIGGPGEVYAAIYGGIVRSDDGGGTWTTVLGDDLINAGLEDLNESGASYYTNVMVTPAGNLYATLSTRVNEADSTENKGIFYSENGLDWQDITPPGFLEFHDRIVMSYAPSNENMVYFFISRGGEVDLWLYTGSTWTSRKNGIPVDHEELPEMETQNSYNMVVKVHPEDPDIVFLGGTNLFRSTDGFLSINNTTHVGGYSDVSSSSLYEGHHPDQHDIVFYPSDPNKMLTANDGGIRLTFNNRSEEINWASLNNGYITSQFYTIALSRDPESDEAMGGMQDNGTYLMPFNGQNVSWKRVIGGDGSYTASTRDNLFWYSSFQQGPTFRMQFNSSNNLISFAQVDPIGGGGYLFINPFILDPFNNNRMYLAGGNVLWRNDNLSQVPSGRQTPTAVGWTELRETELAGMTLTTMDASSDIQGIVYYGSAEGHVFKLTDAHNGNVSRTQVMSQEGYVTCACIDPSDSENAMFTYGNYNIRSIFSISGGDLTPVDVGGNLEENEDGSGDGPSIRWCEIVPLADGGKRYFVGTSIGLFSTDQLDGTSTHWTHQSEGTLGSSIVRMMDFNTQNGRLAVATHGNGVFETTIQNIEVIDPQLDPVPSIQVNTGFPNSFDDIFTISLNIPEDGRVTIFVVNPAGQKVKRLLDAPQFAGEVIAQWDGIGASGMPMPNGLYFYHIEYHGQMSGGKMILFR